MQQPPEKSLIKYYDALDTLRAIAVFFVFMDHAMYFLFKGSFDPGAWGVDFFFVISGFLITDILLEAKKKRESGGQSLKKTLGVFYARRFLRIFPLYYLVILVCLLLNFQQVREYLGFDLTYTVNFIPVFRKVSDPVSYFWSLSVEEQFYLCWPLLIMVLPVKYLLKIFVVIILLVNVLNIIFYHKSLLLAAILFHSPLGYVNALMGGGILALCVYQKRQIKNSLALVLLLVSLFIYVTIMFFYPGIPYAEIMIGIVDPFSKIMAVYLCIHYSNPFLKALWNISAIRYFGKISYGFYMLHPIIIQDMPRVFETFTKIPFHRFAGKFQVPIYFIVTFLLAALSWELYEKKVLNLKKYFVY